MLETIRKFTARVSGCVLALGLLFVVGCGSKLPTVEGTVTLDGDPVPNARVVFESPNRPTATAKTDDEGYFELVTASQRGIAEGSYGVSVSAYKTKDGGTESPMPILLTPKKYNLVSTSGLTAEVVPGQNTVDLELQTKAKK